MFGERGLIMRIARGVYGIGWEKTRSQRDISGNCSWALLVPLLNGHSAFREKQNLKNAYQAAWSLDAKRRGAERRAFVKPCENDEDVYDGSSC